MCVTACAARNARNLECVRTLEHNLKQRLPQQLLDRHNFNGFLKMLIRQGSRLVQQSDRKLTFLSSILIRRFCIEISNKPIKRQERKLREWRKFPEPGPKSFLGLWDKAVAWPKKAKRDTSWGKIDKGENLDFTIANLRKTFSEAKVDYKKDQQKYIPERLQTLGADLAAAHFLVYRGGKVRFRGSTDWINTVDKYMELPTIYDPKYILTDIDCSGMELYYEGLMNFENLTRIKWASFKGNPVLDEWCLDRIVGQMPRLEYLDISECPKLDERGLEALYKLFNLKTLIVTNYNQSAAFELTCMMLEDCNPDLKYEILEPGQQSKLSENKSEDET